MRKTERTHGKAVGFKLGPYAGKNDGTSFGLNVGYTVGVPMGQSTTVGLRLGRAADPNDAGASEGVENSFCANAGTSPSSSTLSAVATAGFRVTSVGAALGFGSSSVGFGMAEFGTEVGLGASEGPDVAMDPCRSSRRRMATIAMARTIIVATMAAV